MTYPIEIELTAGGLLEIRDNEKNEAVIIPLSAVFFRFRKLAPNRSATLYTTSGEVLAELTEKTPDQFVAFNRTEIYPLMEYVRENNAVGRIVTVNG